MFWRGVKGDNPTKKKKLFATAPLANSSRQVISFRYVSRQISDGGAKSLNGSFPINHSNSPSSSSILACVDVMLGLDGGVAAAVRCSQLILCKRDIDFSISTSADGPESQREIWKTINSNVMSHENGWRRKERRIVICKVKLELWREASEVTTVWLTPICCKQTSHRVVHSRRKSLEKVIIRRCWLFPHETKLSNREHFRNPHLMRQSDDEWKNQCKPNLSFLCVFVDFVVYKTAQWARWARIFHTVFPHWWFLTRFIFSSPLEKLDDLKGRALKVGKFQAQTHPNPSISQQHWNVAHKRGGENCNAKSS